MLHVNMNNYKDLARQGAKNYAVADKSDPFAYNRAMSHLENGLCKPISSGDGRLSPGHYDATPDLEMREFTDPVSGAKTKYQIPVYRDIKRI